MGSFFAILAALSILHGPAAGARTAGSIEPGIAALQPGAADQDHQAEPA
jgi:hypothetical protein